MNLRAEWPRKHVSHGIVVAVIFGDILRPDLDLLNLRHDLRTHALLLPDTLFGWV